MKKDRKQRHPLTKFAFVVVTAVGAISLAAVPALAAGDDCPAGGTKIDSEGPASFSCGEGQVVTGICVKAGRPSYGVGEGATPEGAGCYVYEGVGESSSGAVSGGGTSRDCKGISHVVYYCGPGEPPSEPVCGDGVVEGSEECDPPGRISEGLVCNESCHVVESPTPEPEPVCGNGVIEPGEDCDPPGALGEGFTCNESCQVVETPHDGGECTAGPEACAG